MFSTLAWGDPARYLARVLNRLWTASVGAGGADSGRGCGRAAGAAARGWDAAGRRRAARWRARGRGAAGRAARKPGAPPLRCRASARAPPARLRAPRRSGQDAPGWWRVEQELAVVRPCRQCGVGSSQRGALVAGVGGQLPLEAGEDWRRLGARAEAHDLVREPSALAERGREQQPMPGQQRDPADRVRQRRQGRGRVRRLR